MANVTKPIALDESLNTTELSSRNVADVLAQELSAVATAIGGIAVPSADHVSYDNSVSGLSATDVQNALDEIVSDIPTVNNGTLTIQQNGTSIGSFSANTASDVTANIKTPTADKKTATDEFTTADGGLLSKCQINLVPVQSGSGDPSPDNVRPISGHTEVDLQVVGKNFLPLPIAETKNGVTLTRLSDGSFKIEGTASAHTYFDSFVGDFNSTYYAGYKFIFSVIGSFSGMSFRISGADRVYLQSFGTPDVFTTIADNGSDLYFALRIANGTAIPTGGAIIKPMLVKPSETDPTFAPYLGHLYQVQIGSTVYGGYVDLVSGVMTVDREFVSFDGTDVWTSSQTIGRFIYTASDGKLGTSAFAFTKTSHYHLGASTDSNVYWCDNAGNNLRIIFNTIYTSKSAWLSYLSNQYGAGTPLQIVYPLATPFTIQLTPQQIETLAGQNNLSTPLSGQSIETNGVEYKELFTFADVKEYVDKKIPDAPTTDGTYTLQAVVSGGVPTYSWV